VVTWNVGHQHLWQYPPALYSTIVLYEDLPSTFTVFHLNCWTAGRFMFTYSSGFQNLHTHKLRFFIVIISLRKSVTALFPGVFLETEYSISKETILWCKTESFLSLIVTLCFFNFYTLMSYHSVISWLLRKRHLRRFMLLFDFSLCDIYNFPLPSLPASMAKDFFT
jgi:hypothetical protein